MSRAQEIIAAARAPGPFFALAEPGMTPVFSWGEGKGELRCQSRKFYSPRDRASPLWSGFSLSASLTPAHTESCDRLPLICPPVALPAARTMDDGWEKFCASISSAIREGRLEKAVPARHRAFSFAPEFRPGLLDRILTQLYAPTSARTFRFLLREKNDIFFGASPELLFRRERGNLFVPAIAGTRAIAGGTEGEAATALLGSDKDQHEHRLVVQGILASLRGLGLKPAAPEQPDIVRVPGLVHLYTPITAADDASITSERLIAALHPTPAVGGLPKQPAQDFLFEREPWDRGLFASPLLFSAPGREICLVAIRSGLLTASELYLFAGAGFVEGSNAVAELFETDRKMDVMQTVLTGKAP